MHDGLTTALRAFYDLWDRRDMDGLMRRFHPAAVLRDHRAMASWGGTPEDWRAMVEGWWSVLPDGRVVRVAVLRAAGSLNAHAVTTAGTDSISGGPAEFEFFVVADVEDGLITSCDFFDDEAAAIDHFEQRVGR